MSKASNFSLQLHPSIKEIDAAQWDALTDNTPLLSHAFLSALENSGSVGGETGWHPYPLAVYDSQHKLVGAMPLYLKTHSYGEYVFDWAWADAYQKNQLAYYPKIISAIPFSPVTSKRLLTQDKAVSTLMLNALPEILASHELSSAHILFPDESDSQLLDDAKWLKRKGIQFRWCNYDYADMDAFLASLSAKKRKKIRHERKKVEHSGVTCRWVLGSEATQKDWDFFYACYCNTYLEHRSTPYLTREFFHEIAKTLADNMLLIVAELDKEPIACALNFYNDTVLFGRYWGATQFVSGLHFELCYYQAQEFCIANNIRFFEGGAQGEHKLARGFEPRETVSYHNIVHPQFESAIQHFLDEELKGVAAYTNELEDRAPFKKKQLKQPT